MVVELFDVVLLLLLVDVLIEDGCLCVCVILSVVDMAVHYVLVIVSRDWGIV